MENISEEIKEVFGYELKTFSKLKFKSIDEEDLDQQFIIDINQITSVERGIDDNKIIIVWWKKWSQLEGKYVTMSNHFIEYEFL